MVAPKLTQLRRVLVFFFFQAEDGIRDVAVTGVQTCALPISRIGGAVVAVASAGVAWGAWRAGPRTPDRSRRSRWRGGGRFAPGSTSWVERGASPPRAGPPGARAPRRESRRTLWRSRQHRVRHLSGLRGRGRPRPHPAHQRPRAVRDREVGVGQGRAVGADREGPLVLGGDRLE